MNRVQLSHDGLVIVEGAAGVYIDTPQNFALDAGQAAPGAAGLVYAPGLMNCVIDAAGNQRASGLNAAALAALDGVIGNVGQLLAARASRVAAADTAAAAARLAAMTVDQLRALKYAERGATVDALVVALWEYAIEGRSNAADALQAVRVSVKSELPK